MMERRSEHRIVETSRPIEVFVEVPKGSRNKYEADPTTGVIRLDRTLFTSTHYPADYGFVVGTMGEDGDPLDALVLLDEPTFPGCHVDARPIGVFWMSDEEGRDPKLLCVPEGDPRWLAVRDLPDVPAYLLEEITHFFVVYKQLEPGKATAAGGWGSAADADRAVRDALDRYDVTR
jgi:inorganic pyrophosphatase